MPRIIKHKIKEKGTKFGLFSKDKMDRTDRQNCLQSETKSRCKNKSAGQRGILQC